MVPNVVTNLDNEQLVFALDIGTRTVIGIVGKYENEVFKILACEIEEHDKRNMYDGQIHDINGVVQIVKRVKERLEEKLNMELDKVAIAAAGRALRTERVRLDREIDSTREIDRKLVESLEMEAIQKAQQVLDESTNIESKYYCVGYTVVNYYLDNNFIENPEGHRGSKLGVDLLATFLPHIVVDSLYTVMSRVGLEVINMTLEPIAAINVAIKKNLRLLNLALIDIGAGTSDIAITKDGTIVAYAMASVAGDEITEAIAKTYLLDFDSAEKLKISLNKQQNHKFHDVVGIEHNLTTEEILNSIQENIKKLAKEISDSILKYNEKAPSAIFLIGGGGQIPRLSEYIAEYLELPKERVVVRSSDIIEKIDDIPEELNGPHAITPIGIGVTAVKDMYKDFLEVTVNGQKIKLFNSKDIKVSDALVLVGYNPRNLIPKRGEDFIYFVNEQKLRIRGEIGKPSEIYVNNQISNLEQKLKNGDIVQVKEATVGKKPNPRLFDCINMKEYITFNGEKVYLIKQVKVNGDVVSENIPIKEYDKIQVNKIKTVSEVFDALNINPDSYMIYKNEELIYKDEITAKEINDYKENTKSAENNSLTKTIRLNINGEDKVIEHNEDKFLFIKIFDYLDFDLSKPKGMLYLKVNGAKAEYTQVLKDGDKIEIYWKKDRKFS
ncbi:cell division FtsA domain-containing protein [Caldisalinibacter kiritimatiensis]|uniref:Cell division protein FtsA n=1 Tax=Caldisalinibacter kiritimatiensis TaxID=1304284 RepID=R1CMH7_9FIRM|nr:cell division FtsA domain-containing protein [Caldisalinibacter kiritimatiensis]EOC99905.1 Cell division protein FtsA [Caldisalinibacter kiritimatiensis]